MAIFSKYPIIESLNLFEPSLGYYQNYSVDSELYKIHINGDKSKYYAAFELPKNVLLTCIDTPGGIIRNLTVHYPISYKTLETLSAIKVTRFINQIITQSRPGQKMLLTGDFNLQPGCHSFELLESDFVRIKSNEIDNTLNPDIHLIFKLESDPKRNIDHIFVNGLEALDFKSVQVNVSDHLPLIITVK